MPVGWLREKGKQNAQRPPMGCFFVFFLVFEAGHVALLGNQNRRSNLGREGGPQDWTVEPARYQQLPGGIAASAPLDRMAAWAYR